MGVKGTVPCPWALNPGRSQLHEAMLVDNPATGCHRHGCLGLVPSATYLSKAYLSSQLGSSICYMAVNLSYFLPRLRTGNIRLDFMIWQHPHDGSIARSWPIYEKSVTRDNR